MSQAPVFLGAIASLMLAAQPTADAQPAPAAGAEPLYLLLYAPGPAWRAGVPMSGQALGPHGAYYRGLLDSGRVVAAGGYTDRDGGMAIVRATTIDDAKAMLAVDPAITAGVFVGEVRVWRTRFRAREFLSVP